MSSLALMRWLERAPERYDAGMRVLTLGRASEMHSAAAAEAAATPGLRVLEVGAGTGALTARLSERGAHVTAVDQDPAMLDQARARLVDAPTPVDWLERTAAEIDALPEASFDAVAASFSLSEMAASERAYVLSAAAARLRPGGRIVVADEVIAPAGARRWLQRLARAPQRILAWALGGSVSAPIPDLAGELRGAGLVVRSEKRWLVGTYALVVAERIERSDGVELAFAGGVAT